MDIIDSVDVDAWETFVTGSAQASFYHTPHWHKIVTCTFPQFSMAAKKFVFEDGTCALMPLVKTEKGLLFKKKIRLKSGVLGVEGGIVANRKLSAEQENRIYRHLTDTRASITIITNPYADYTLPDYFKIENDFTLVIRLPGADQPPTINFSRGAKSNLKQARKNDLTVRTARTVRDIDAYYSIYQDTLKRWGDRVLFTYPEKIFYEIFKLPEDLMKIWLVEQNGNIIAGAVIFYFNEIASYWHASSLRKYFSCYPNNLLQTEIIKDAAQKHKLYDMGRSGNQKGVEQFKKSLGAETFPLANGVWKYRWQRKKTKQGRFGY